MCTISGKLEKDFFVTPRESYGIGRRAGHAPVREGVLGRLWPRRTVWVDQLRQRRSFLLMDVDDDFRLSNLLVYVYKYRYICFAIMINRIHWRRRQYFWHCGRLPFLSTYIRGSLSLDLLSNMCGKVIRHTR
jgi:hypothetical protein